MIELWGAGIYFSLLDSQYSVRLLDYTRVYDAEHLAILLALRRMPVQFSKVYILSNSLSITSSLKLGLNSSDYVLLSTSAQSNLGSQNITRFKKRKSLTNGLNSR